MPRKAFIADVTAAAATSVTGVSGVVRGEEDGELDFSYALSPAESINVHLIAAGKLHPHAKLYDLNITAVVR
jgi:hypothetical protein